MRSKSRPGRTRPFTLVLLALSTAGCALSPGAPPTQFAGLTIPVDPSLRQGCQHPPLPLKSASQEGEPTTTVGAIEAFAVAADTQLEACSIRKAALVGLIDMHNDLVARASEQIATARKPWFLRWGR